MAAKVVRWEEATNQAKDNAEAYCGECDYSLSEGEEEWSYCPNCGIFIIWHREDTKPKEAAQFKNWNAAIAYLHMLVREYKKVGPPGFFGLSMLNSYLKRYEKGERSDDLYQEIMESQ
jgi:predicted RNA-binding Zn-ribbon protein involved in translation (DUF1610 family)